MDKHMNKGEYQRELQRRNRARKRLWKRIHLISLIVMIMAAVIILINCISPKKHLRNQGVDLYNEGNYTEALSKFDKALATKQWFSDGLDVDIQMYRADCMIHMQEFVEATETYKKIKDNYSGRHYDKEQIGYLIEITNALEKFRQGDYVSTVATFTRAVENCHYDMSIYAALCYENQKNFEKMKEYLDIYAATFGMNSYIYYKYASYYYQQKDYTQTVAYLSQGESCGDTAYLRQIQYAKIVCYKETMNYDMAYDLATQYVAAYPDDQNGKDLQAYLDTRVNLDEVPINDRFHLFDGGEDSVE